MEYYVPSQLTMIRLYFGSTLFSVMLASKLEECCKQSNFPSSPQKWSISLINIS